MRKLAWMCGTCAVMMWAGLAWAQGGGGRAGGRGGMGGMGQQISVLALLKDKDLGVTDAQMKEAAGAIAKYKEADTKATADMTAARATMADDAEGARGKMTAAMTARTAAQADLLKALAPILGPEKSAKLERAAGPAGALDRLVADVKKLELTADQKTKLDETAKAADTAAKGKTGAEFLTPYREAITKVQDLLTEEQRPKLQMISGASSLKLQLAALDLTADQSKQIDPLLADMAKAADRAAAGEVRTKIMALLTDAQRAQMPAGGRMGGGRRGGN